MDGNSIIMAGGLMSLGVRAGMGCWKRQQKAKKLHKQKLSSLIISKGCGKTQLKKSLESLSSDLVIVDMNEAIKGNDDLEKLVNGKAYIDSLLAKFPKKKFLLLLSTKEESEYFGVDILNTFVVCPSIKLFESLKGNIDLSVAGNADMVNEMEKARLALIRDTDTDNLNIFGSFDELYSVIKTVYKLQSTF